MEALKHIYSTLLTNKKIFLSIDVPKHEANELEFTDSDENVEE